MEVEVDEQVEDEVDEIVVVLVAIVDTVMAPVTLEGPSKKAELVEDVGRNDDDEVELLGLVLAPDEPLLLIVFRTILEIAATELEVATAAAK